MTEFIEVENYLIAKISDKDYRDSLTQIRKSAEAIWSIDAPRIIHDFTDHGLEHSLRLIKNASKLLKANKGNALSDEEMYLLIAGIYLHDIGMQCDIIKFPGIKEKAVEFGATYNIDFTSKISSQYTLEDQKEIRKNHHFLSAAKIDYAHHNKGTDLDNSIQTIPGELIKDLMDICMYHSSLNLSECPIKFEILKQGRKQFVAALVRFSDELDIDKHRVSIDTVKNYSIDSHNAFYWWLHQLTIIEITDNNLNLTIRLSPDDFNSFGPFVKKTYLDEFRKKNNAVLDILNINNILIAINANSDVISDEYAPKLPEEIVQVIQELKQDDVINNITAPDKKQVLNIQLKNFPKPKPYFAGRVAELKELKNAFEKNSFIFIEGGGGIGKTQFVSRFIEDLGINEKIVWYDCIPTSQPDDVISGAGFEELLKGKEKTEREKFSAFKDKIEDYDLVIFLDNYQEVENIPSFKSFLVFNNEYLRKGHLIVVGRDNIITPQLQPKRIRLDGLGEDSISHAQRLIKNSYPNLTTTPSKELTTICDTLKGYPLAIDLAIYLLSLKVSVQNIINVAVTEAQSEGSEIEKISERLLNEIFTRPDASEDEREFMKLFSIFRGKIQDKEALSVIPHTIFENASRKLINRNLLEINNDYFELHPLIREFCYDELINKKEIHYQAAKYYIGIRTNKWNPELEEKIFYHLSCSEKWMNISDIIFKNGSDFILHGYLDRLQQMITLIKQENIFKPKFDIFEGDIAQIRGDWDLALAIFNKAIQSYDEEVRTEGMIRYGEMLYRQGNVKEARMFFEDAKTITEYSIYKKSYARALNNLGLVNEFFGNLVDALNLLNEALSIREKLDDHEDTASTLCNIANIKEILGDVNGALDLYEESLKIEEEIGNKSGVSISLNNIGSLKFDLGLKKEALELYEESLKIDEEIGNKSGVSISLNNIGSIKSDLGLKKEALELYEESLKIDEEIGNKSGIAISLLNIGSIKDDLGLKKEALKLYNRSLKISEEIGNKSGIATSLNNIGSIKDDLDLKKEALELYERSLKINEEIGNKSSIATILLNIGTIKSNLGFKKEALAFYQRSLKINEEIGNKSGIASSLLNIGSRKAELGLINEAHELFERSLKIYEEIYNKSGIARSLNTIGGFLFRNNLELEKAFLYLLKSFALYKQMGMSDQKLLIGYLIQIRQKFDKSKFKEMVLKAIQLLDNELKILIDLDEIFGEPIKVEKKPGRNDPCFCNSGKKYKNCHGK
jgi:tetratricopeptide (TPR) repeat protein